MDRINWLLVGAGDISRKRVAPALAAAAGSRIAAVCDVNTQSAASLAARLGIAEVYTDLEDALERSRTDAVYLATPVHLHAPQAVRSLESGRHVLVEKPLGLTADDCRLAVEAGRRSGRTAACAYYRRTFPRYIHARDMLASGEFGDIVLVRMVFFSWFDPRPDDPKYWRVVRALSGGGPLSDMGTHMFDVLIGLFGMPVSVYASCDNLQRAWDVEDTASMILRLPGGAHVTASFSWCSRTWRHEFEIAGTQAKICWLPFDTGPVLKTVGRETVSLDLPSAENVHLPVIEDFLSAIRENRPPLCPLEEAMKTTVLLDAVYRSSREKREIVPSGADGNSP